LFLWQTNCHAPVSYFLLNVGLLTDVRKSIRQYQLRAAQARIYVSISSSGSVPVPQFPQNANIWASLGGDATAPAVVESVVGHAVTGLLADPVEAPYFAAVTGNSSHSSKLHDTPSRLTACLNLQFKSLFGGPYTYPGPVTTSDVDPQPEMCQDMVTVHKDVGTPGCVFDQFMVDLVAVLNQDLRAAGFTPTQIAGVLAQVGPTLTGMKSSIVSPTPVYLAPTVSTSCAS
jgi:hypothetical protein